MGFELPDGKTARNLQDQVKFLSEKLKDLYAAFNNSGLKKIVIVEELPEVGDPSVLYLLAKEDPDEGNYYDEYLWYDNQWELIGSTQIDLSDYCTLSTDQTITGAKNIQNKLVIEATDTSDANSLKLKNAAGYTWSLNVNQYSGLRIAAGSEEASTSQKFYLTTTYLIGPGMDLGNSGSYWKDLYLNGNIYFATSGYYIREVSGYMQFYTGGSEKVSLHTAHAYVRLNLIPGVNNTYDIGSASANWKDLYLSGDAIAKTFSQTSPNWEGNLTLDSVPTGITQTISYAGAKIINNVMHLVLCFKLSNITIDPIYINQIRFYTEAVPAAYRGKIYDINGFTLNDSGSGLIRIGPGVKADLNGGSPDFKKICCQRYLYQLFFDVWDYENLPGGATKAYYAEMQLTLL